MADLVSIRFDALDSESNPARSFYSCHHGRQMGSMLGPLAARVRDGSSGFPQLARKSQALAATSRC